MAKIMSDNVLFVLIDEAKALLQESDIYGNHENKKCLLRVFRQSIAQLFAGVKVVFLRIH